MLCFDAHNYANYAPQISHYATQISHYAPEICRYASKQNNLYSMLSGSALVLLEFPEVSSRESSTSPPSLETVVNFVAEAKLSDGLLVLQPRSLRSAIFSHQVTWKLRMRNRRCDCMGVVHILYSKVYHFPHTHRHFVGQQNTSNVHADPLLAAYQQC